MGWFFGKVAKRGNFMKRIKLFLMIYLIAIFMCGCSNNSYREFSHNSSEKDAIYAVFGEYSSTTGTGIVHINEKSNERDRTYIFYLVKVPSLENYKKALKKNLSDDGKNSASDEKIYEQVKEEATEEVMNKIEKLYTNKNVDKIRIEVGVAWPYGNHNYTKPGEKLVGSKIAYIKTFNFTREDYNVFLKQYNNEN